MPESKDKNGTSDQSKSSVTVKQRNVVRRIGPRSIVLVGLLLSYGILMVATPASDPKALVGLLILTIFLFILLRTDAVFVKLVKDTRTTVGLVSGATGFGLGLYALVDNLLTNSVYYLLIAVLFLVMFTPLFFYKLSVAFRKGLDSADPLLVIGLVIVLLSSAFFLLSPSPTLSLVALLALIVGMMMRARGSGREKRKAEVEEIALPS